MRFEKWIRLAIMYGFDPDNENRVGHGFTFDAIQVILSRVKASFTASVPRWGRTCCLSGIESCKPKEMIPCCSRSFVGLL